MPSTVTSPVIRLAMGTPSDVQTDLLVVPVFDGESAAEAMPALDQATHGEVRRATESGELRGRLYEIFVTPATAGGWKCGRIALIGAGKVSDFDSERLRKVATTAALVARGRRMPRVAFLLRGPVPAVEGAQVVAEGLVLAAFSVDQYKTGERFGPPATELTIAAPERDATEARALEQAIARGQILG